MKQGIRKVGAIAAIAAWWMMTTMPAAHAYIDPSATTYLIQAIAGIAVIFWRRAKKKLKDKVGIDFDKNKETEEAVTAVNPDEENKG